jgi:hypothetical protein
MERDYYGEEIIARFGEWYITATTVIYEPAGYEITRLTPERIGWWHEHMSEKRWYTVAVRLDFLAAAERFCEAVTV